MERSATRDRTMMTNTAASTRDLERLSAAIFDRYGIRVRAIVTLRTVFGVLAEDGRQFVWKWIREHDHVPRLYPVAELSRALRSVGIQAAGPVRNLAGEILTVIEDQRAGFLQPWLRGRHVDITDRQERLGAVSTIGAMHACSRSLPLHLWTSLGGTLLLLGKLQVKQQTLQNIWPLALRGCPALSRSEESTFAAVQTAVQALTDHADGSRIPRYVSIPLPRTAAFCHRDLAPHNMLWQGQGKAVALIDFDHAGVDDPFLDVMQIANHALFLTSSKDGHFLDIVQAYDRVCPLTEEREKVLWKLFRFPDVLIRATAEWVKTGCRPERRGRVIAALHKEQLRSVLWERDYRSRFGSTR